MPDHDYSGPNPATSTSHVGSYRRVLPVSLERMYENTLDWEHLPYLHESSFGSIECLDAGPWGWRARVVDSSGGASELELLLDRSRRRWITRNISGPSQGAEIWTQVAPLAPHKLEIVVDFFVPDVPVAAQEKVGRAYASAYTRLYDEDVAMMVARQAHLDRRVEGTSERERVVGPVDQLAERLIVSFRGRDLVLVQHEGDWHVFPAVCPHQLGPLAQAPLIAGTVTCPWHGYQFDVRTGANLSGQSCRFSQLPKVLVREQMLVLTQA